MSIAEFPPIATSLAPAESPAPGSPEGLLTAIHAAVKLRIEWVREEHPWGREYYAPCLEPDGATLSVSEAAALAFHRPLRTTVDVRSADGVLWSVDVEAARVRQRDGWAVALWFRGASY